jgi:hypothetical protein
MKSAFKSLCKSSRDRPLQSSPTAIRANSSVRSLFRRLRRRISYDLGNGRSETQVGPAIINMDVGVIRRMLKRAKRWHLVGGDLRPLKEPRSIGRALTYDEKLRLLRVAEWNEDWQRAQAAMSLALCTTMRGCEIKRLQFHDLRYHPIRELAESQVSDQTITAIAGHVSQKMLARYSHVRTEARRQAVSALSAKPITRRREGKGGGYDTNYDTN